MAVIKQALLLFLGLAVVSLASATGNISPPPADDGCFNGRLNGAINVQAVFDMGGVTGYVQFFQPGRGQPTEVNVNLDGLEQFAGTYPWHAHELPVRDALLKDFPCSSEEIGSHYDPENANTNEDEYNMNCNQQNRTACEVGDFGRKLGRLRNIRDEQNFVDETLDLYGPNSIVGRSLVIHYPGEPNDRFICANIEPTGCRVKNLRAEFDNGILQGEIVIRHTAGMDSAKIFVDLFQVDGNTTDREKTWNIHFGPTGADGQCDGVREEVFGDESNFEFTRCSNENHRECPLGDLTMKCGPLQFRGGRARLCCTDTQLGSVPFDSLYSPRAKVFLSVLVRDIAVDSPVQPAADGCAQFEKVLPIVAKGKFQTATMDVAVRFYQNSPFDRTFVRPTITGIRQRDLQLLIRTEPVGLGTDGRPNCTDEALGPVFSKPGSPVFGRPLGMRKTGDSVLIGNLAPKVPIPTRAQRLVSTSSSHFLPLFGPHSIIGRSLTLVDGSSEVLGCTTINRLTADQIGAFASITGFRDNDKI